MEKEKSQFLKLGILVAVGIGLFTIAIYFIGTKQNLFSSTVTVKAYFNNVSGLIEGNKVRYSGITIGSVSDITIVSDSAILVKMTVDKKAVKFIRKDSKVAIGSDGLMGSKIIDINPGTSSAGTISDQNFLQTEDPVDLQDVLEEAKMVISDGRALTQNLIKITDKINNGDGDIARLINEQYITKRLEEVGDSLLQVVGKAYSIAGKIDNGQGDLGRLLNDSTISTGLITTLENIKTITAKTDSISNQILMFSQELNTGNGIIQRLVHDTVMAENVDTAIVKISKSVDDVVQAAETIESSWIFNLFSKDDK